MNPNFDMNQNNITPDENFIDMNNIQNFNQNIQNFEPGNFQQPNNFMQNDEEYDQFNGANPLESFSQDIPPSVKIQESQNLSNITQNLSDLNLSQTQCNINIYSTKNESLTKNALEQICQKLENNTDNTEIMQLQNDLYSILHDNPDADLIEECILTLDQT